MSALMGIQRTLARSSLRAGRYLQLRHKTISASGSTDAIAQTSNTDTITRQPGAAFPGDLRSTSGLGLGDEIETHTGKWMTGSGKSPMDYCAEAEPMQVHGLTVASYGADDPALGAPVEYIDLRGTTRDRPATCKYTGNKYWSDDWRTPSKAGH